MGHQKTKGIGAEMVGINNVSNIEQTSINNSNFGKRSIAGNSSFSSYLDEAKSLNDMFEEAANKYNISADLLKAIGKAESDYNANAVSKCGAQGIMQLMPATATELGVTDSFDAEQNIMGGAKYISQLLKKYDGDTNLALAAYNAGMGNVAKYGGIPPFEETQNYVVKVNKYMKQGVDAGDTTAVASATPAIVPTLNYYSTVTKAAEMVSSNVNQSLQTAFTYDDYMKFIDLLLAEKEEESNKTK